MFNKINSKLSDESFVQATVNLRVKDDFLQEGDGNLTTDSNTTTSVPVSNPNQVNSTIEATASSAPAAVPTEEQVLKANMTDEDVACYSARYKDLKGQDARLHYLTVGKA